MSDIKISYDTVLLTLMDYAYDRKKPVTLDKKIEMLEQYNRYLIRNKPLNDKEIEEWRDLRNAYKIELEALKDQRDQEQTNTNTDTDINNIIDLAIRPLKKKNKKRARKFMQLYYEQKSLTPGYNPDQMIKEIGWVSPSSNTQKDWMEKFDKAEKTLSISN